jgi:protein transport protein SEC24
MANRSFGGGPPPQRAGNSFGNNGNFHPPGNMPRSQHGVHGPPTRAPQMGNVPPSHQRPHFSGPPAANNPSGYYRPSGGPPQQNNFSFPGNNHTAPANNYSMHKPNQPAQGYGPPGTQGQQTPNRYNNPAVAAHPSYGAPNNMGGAPMASNGAQPSRGAPNSTRAPPIANNGAPPSRGVPNNMGGAPVANKGAQPYRGGNSSMGAPPILRNEAPPSRGAPPTGSMGAPPIANNGVPPSRSAPNNSVRPPQTVHRGAPPATRTYGSHPPMTATSAMMQQNLGNSGAAPHGTRAGQVPHYQRAPPTGAPPTSFQSQVRPPVMMDPRVAHANGPPTSRTAPANAHPPIAGSSGPPLDGGRSTAPATAARQMKAATKSPSGIAKPKRDNRIDPRQIPRPKFDRKVTLFKTKAAKVLIPSSLNPVDFSDEGETAPSFIRMSVKHVPRSQEILKQSGIPFGAFIRPLAPAVRSEQTVPTADFSRDGGPVRCTRCGGYVSSFSVFEDDGRVWRCSLCEKLNNVPPEYRSSLDGYGNRYDRGSRPELSSGTVDLLVPDTYCARPKQIPTYVFVLDVSPNSIATGALKETMSIVKDCMSEIGDGESQSLFGLVTFDSEVHFYNIGSKGEDIPVTVMAEVNDVFAPIPANMWLVNVSENSNRIDQLFDLLSELFLSEGAKGVHTGPPYLKAANAFAAAVTSVAYSLSEHGGRIIACQSSLPTVGVGKMDCREEAKLYGRQGEAVMWFPDPAKPSYKRLGKYCAEKQICVDIISMNSKNHCDVATMRIVPEKTGGEMLYYPEFDLGSRYYQDRMRQDVKRLLTAYVALEATLKIRCSEGLRVVAIHGPGDADRDPSQVNVALLGEDLSFCASFEYTTDLGEDQKNAYLQVSLLHTSMSGRRTVRVMNLQLPLTSQLSSTFRHSDIDTVCNLLCRKAVRKVYENVRDSSSQMKRMMSGVRDHLLSRVIKMLHAYRRYCATASSSGQLILPEALKFLPLLTLALRKSVWLQSNEISITPNIRADERAASMSLLQSASPALFMSTLYPYLFCLHEMKAEHGLPHKETPSGESRPDADDVFLPKPQYPSSEHLTEMGLLLLVNGLDFYFWVGRKVLRTTLQDLFNRTSLPNDEAKVQKILFQKRDNMLSRRIFGVINAMKQRMRVDPSRIRLHVVKQMSGVRTAKERSTYSEDRFLSLLIEDKSRHGMSHVEMLCHVHKKIQLKMSDYD